MLRKYLVPGGSNPQRAEQIWAILSGLVMNWDRAKGPVAKITYAELAERMGYREPNHAALGLARPLDLVGRMCLDSDLPPLNAIVVGKHTGVPGAEVLLRPGSTVEADQIGVMATNWYAQQAPSGGAFRALGKQVPTEGENE